MFKTQERIFKRLHAEGLLLDFYPEDYKFYSHSLKPHDRAAGAMRWTMMPTRGSKGPVICSQHTVNDVCKYRVVRYVDPTKRHEPTEFELVVEYGEDDAVS